MSKLLDLLAQQNAIAEQQNAIAEQIKTLKADEKEAKVLKFVEDLEALRNKHGYSVPDFIGVVHSLHNVKTTAKTPKSVSEKTPRAKSPKYKVMIDGAEVILQSKKVGAVGKSIEALGFTTYADYLADLMKKSDVETFDALIEKLGGVAVTA